MGKLTLYTRIGCSLCEQMEVELAPLAAELDLHVDMVDVDTDPQLIERYGSLVPVLEGPNGEICHYFLDPDKLRSHFIAH